MSRALVIEQTLSDGSHAYDVSLRVDDTSLTLLIGCATRDQASSLAHALDEAVFVEDAEVIL